MTSLYQILPLAALVIFIGAALGQGRSDRIGWRGVVVVLAAFTLWSIYTIVQEGPVGFWPNHTANAWGNQVWFDLLIALGIGWALLVPRARAAGMGIWPWLVLILCTGSIGLLAMLGRCLFLENAKTSA